MSLYSLILTKWSSGAVGLIAFALSCSSSTATSSSCASPDGKIVVTVLDAPLSYSALYGGVTMVESSPLGVTRNGVDLGTASLITGTAAYSTNETFVSRTGMHPNGTNWYQGRIISVTNAASSLTYAVNLRVYNNGFAVRYEFSNAGSNNITKEATGFVIPAGSTVWGETNTSNYEKYYVPMDITAWRTNVDFGPPVTIQLPGSAGYLALTESTLGVFGNSFVRKVANSPGRMLQVVYPANQGGSTGASVTGPLNTPWNVVLIGADLNMIVNNDIVESLSPAPDPVLFPQGAATSWATTGRSVWDWLRPQSGGITATNAMINSLWASRMGFEYNTVDDGWAAWTNSAGVVDPWPFVGQIVAYSHALGVKVLVWKTSSQLNTLSQRTTFFQKLQSYGVDGFKADFFDYSSVNCAARERVALQETILREAAAYHLVANFHGSAKPTGQFRTYPNLLGFEAVFGKEQWPNPWMVVTVPFMRFLAGPADFTPMEFGGNIAFEVAHVINMPGPVITFAERSDTIAKSPFASLIRAIPCQWDETIILSQSKLGVTTASARRKGQDWFIGIMNATATQNWSIPLTFLSSNVVYQADLIRQDSTVLERTNATRTNLFAVAVTTTNGSGFVAHLYKSSPVTINTNFLIKGVSIGTSGSWGGQVNTRDKVFDGDVSTYFDAPDSNGDWTGLDLGSGNARIVSFIRYYPRTGWAGRMVPGVFQGANTANFSDAVILSTVNFTPSDGCFSTVLVTNSSAFRYLRYLSPPGGYCNVAEVQFFAQANPDKLTFIGDPSRNQLTFAWPNGGSLLEATNISGPWNLLTGIASPCIITQNQMQRFYRVQYQ